MKQKIVEAHLGGDMFLCPCCNKIKKYYATGICQYCYTRQTYHFNKKYREYCLNKAREQTKSGYRKERHLADKIGNMDNIEKLCLEHGFSRDVAEAIAMDGIILDKKMKERGINLN